MSHSPRRLSTPLILLTVAVCCGLFGCRGSNRLNGLVRVTPRADTDVDVASIDPPKQRLATNRSGGSSDAATTDATVAAAIRASNPTTPNAKRQVLGSASSNTETLSPETADPKTLDQETIDPKVADRIAAAQRTIAAGGKRRDGNPKPSVSSVPSPGGVTASVGDQPSSSARRKNRPRSETVATLGSTRGNPKTKADPRRLSREAILAAFKDYPPAVQREAVRRLLAQETQSQPVTTQPNEEADRLAARVTQRVPDAEPATESAPRPAHAKPATESAAKPATESAAPTDAIAKQSLSPVDAAVEPPDESVANRSVSSTAQPMSPEAALTAALTDLPELPESQLTAGAPRPSRLAGAAPPAAPIDDTEVRPASASSLDQSIIARAAAAAPSVMDRDESELFEMLLDKLASPSPGESEADRAARLIKLRHLMVIAGDPDGAVERIDGMSNDQQEFLRHQLLGLWTMLDPSGHPVPARRLTDAVTQFREATRFAGAATDSLVIRSPTFCTAIEAYGQIEPFASDPFIAGQKVILYCEVENFTANKIAEGFETHLQGSYEVHDERGRKVVHQLLPADRQVSANYLRDYFIAYEMHLPDPIEPGDYRLQLTMQDVNGKKYGQAYLPFTIKKSR